MHAGHPFARFLPWLSFVRTCCGYCHVARGSELKNSDTDHWILVMQIIERLPRHFLADCQHGGVPRQLFNVLIKACRGLFAYFLCYSPGKKWLHRLLGTVSLPRPLKRQTWGHGDTSFSVLGDRSARPVVFVPEFLGDLECWEVVCGRRIEHACGVVVGTRIMLTLFPDALRRQGEELCRNRVVLQVWGERVRLCGTVQLRRAVGRRYFV